ncbi:MAG TPA: HD domain-containing phosphohydrolase [Vicinamibacterales bacterium]|nr:HD domain-containing phosphohydrolase [Vicinamibacterales bacterium]
MTSPATPSSLDPLAVLRGLASLRRLAGSYPAGHPMIAQKLKELDEVITGLLRGGSPIRIDVIRGDVFLDGVTSASEGQANQQLLAQLSALGIDSIHIHEGVQREEMLAVAEFLWQYAESSDSMSTQLAARNVKHISLGRLLPLDTRWRMQKWADAPTGPLDPDYAESLMMAQKTWEDTASGKPLDVVTVRDLVQLLIYKVARSNAALGQILAVKQYENLTYCHSVNVAMLSLLLGKQVGLDEPTLAALVEAALLHDVGKTQIPLDIVRKPGALDKSERRMIEAHTTLGAEILIQTEGLHPLTPTVALEHHRGVKGTGYPDLGEAIPHPMSQIVSVADIYEAITGARTYQAPTPPEKACLIMARMAGEKLNTGLVKKFVNTITFFPVGSLVRTNRNELGLVVETNRREPLHPVLALVDEETYTPAGRVDTSERESSGGYARHITQSMPAPDGLDLNVFLEPARAA